MNRRALGAALALLLASSFARREARATQIPVLDAGQILARYAKALTAAKMPKVLSFEYTVAQLGLRNLEQTHRVYRSALAERDETLVVDGYPLTRPHVRIIANRVYRYDVQSLAPTARTYAFAYTGAQLDGDGIVYAFRTSPLLPHAFAVTEIDLDGETFLPRVVHFRIASATAHGSGTVAYVKSDRYWVVSDADVSAHLTSGAIAHEHIAWSNYRFPPSLPASTFTPPQPPPESEPDAGAAASATAPPLVAPGEGTP